MGRRGGAGAPPMNLAEEIRPTPRGEILKAEVGLETEVGRSPSLVYIRTMGGHPRQRNQRGTNRVLSRLSCPG